MSEQQPPGLGGVFKSVLASFFGVQSHANRERDFTHGNPAHFIIVGVVCTAALVLSLWGIVALILHFAVQ